MRGQFLITLFALSVTSLTAAAQQSVFESGNGDSSVFLSGQTGLLSYNLGDSTARFGYARDAGTANYFGHLAYGLGVGGTVDSGLAQVVNNNTPAPGGFVEGALYWKSLFASAVGKDQTQSNNSLNGEPKCTTPPCPASPPAHTYLPDVGLSTDGLIVQFHYGRTQFYLLPSATVPVPTPTKTNFDQFRATIAYNQVRKYGYGDWTLGVAVAPSSANNLSSLKQETYQPQVITTSGTGQSVLSTKSEFVYVGAYQTFTSLPVNADIVLQPHVFKSLLGFDALLRSETGGGASNRFVSPGVGAYFYKSGSPDVPLGGVTFSYKNGGSQIAVVIGWTFGGTRLAPAAKP